MNRPDVGRMQAGGQLFYKCMKYNERPEGRKGRRVIARAWVRVFMFSVGCQFNSLYPHARNTLRTFRPSGLSLFFSVLWIACLPVNPPAYLRPSIFLCSTTNNSEMVRGEL